jgi:hypothetical protein
MTTDVDQALDTLDVETKGVAASMGGVAAVLLIAADQIANTTVRIAHARLIFDLPMILML